MLSAASGDVAGGLVVGGYSAVTQTATVVAYHVMVNGAVDRARLTAELLVLDGSPPGTRTYRRPTAEFRAWLTAAHAGEPRVAADPSSEPASRMTGVGVWFRRRPEELVTAAIEVGRLTHLDASSVAMGVAAAGAVAGSSLAMNGADLLFGAAETVDRALELMAEDEFRYSRLVAARGIPDWIRSHTPLVTASPNEAVRALSGDNGPHALDGAMLGIVLGASLGASPVRLIEVAAMAGGSELGALVGSVVGARVGLGRWPWRVPNETWFAEIGRRLATGNGEVRDLPVPYAIEERFNMSPEMSGVLDFE
jgi:uncharacterized protein YcfJ